MEKIKLNLRIQKDLKQVFFLVSFLLICIGCDKKDPEPIPSGKTDIQLSLQFLDITHLQTTEEITFSSNVDWKTESNASWVTVNPPSGSAGNGQSLTLAIAANESDQPRKAQVIVKEQQGSYADTLTIRQTGLSAYVPIDWENTSITSVDLKSGNITLNFKKETPVFVDGQSVIVLLTDTSSHIRRIQKASVNGNTATLQTTQGNMTDIFINQQFRLSTEPAAQLVKTKSGILYTTDQNGTIHPSQIIIQKIDGPPTIIYDAEKAFTKAELDTTMHFLQFGENFDGEILKKGKHSELKWEKGALEAKLDGHFYLNFGSIPTDHGITKGDLAEFEMRLIGGLYADFILSFLAEAEEVFETDKPLLLAKTPTVSFLFLQPIPIRITLNTELMADAKFETNAKVEMRGGFHFGPRVELGMNYNKESDRLTPIYEINPSTITPVLTAEGEANLFTYATIYPRIHVKLYDLVGPYLDACPYVANEFKSGFKAGITGSNNTLGWKNKLYTGINLVPGISLEFIGINLHKDLPPIEAWKKMVVETPSKIKLLSPSNGSEYQLEELKEKPITVTVVTTQTVWNTSDIAAPGAVIKFVASNGTVSPTFALANLEGKASADWIPNAPGATLTAHILDSEGKTISSVTFTPEIKEKKPDSTFSGVWAVEGIDLGTSDIVNRGTVTFTSNGTFSREGIIGPPIFKHNINHHLYSMSGSYTYNKATHTLKAKVQTYTTIGIIEGEEMFIDASWSDFYYVGYDIGGQVTIISDKTFEVLQKGIKYRYTRIS